MRQLTPHQYWLKMHQITSFWHNFGIANGLDIPKEYTTEKYTKNGKTYITVSNEYFLTKLQDCIKWLERYKASWNSDENYECYPQSMKEFLEGEQRYKETREPILKMIELLQDI